MDGRMDGWTDGWMNGRMKVRTDGWVNRRMDGGTDGWMNGRMKGRTDGRMDGRTDGWIDGQLRLLASSSLTSSVGRKNKTDPAVSRLKISLNLNNAATNHCFTGAYAEKTFRLGLRGISIDLGVFLCVSRLLQQGWIHLGSLNLHRIDSNSNNSNDRTFI